MLVFTSGTSGEAKGIEYSHGQILVAVRALAAALPGLQAGECHLSWLPMAALFQRMMNLLAVARGITTFFWPDPRTVGQALAEVRPHYFVAVPRFYEKLIQGIDERMRNRSGLARALYGRALALGGSGKPGAKGWAPRAWGRAVERVALDWAVLRPIRRVLGGRIRFLVTGSAPLPPGVSRRLGELGWQVIEGYATSENTVPVSVSTPLDSHPGTVGLPLAPNQVRIGPAGEIQVRGPGVFRGYLGQEEEAHALFTPDGYYCTGDLGRITADGQLVLIGRRGEVFKTSTGRKICPERVEACYRQVCGVEQVVVYGAGRAYLTGLLVLAPGAPEWAVLRERLALSERVLAPYERVRKFLVLAEPFSIAGGELTVSLKLRRGVILERHRARLEALYARSWAGEAAVSGPTGPIEIVEAAHHEHHSVDGYHRRDRQRPGSPVVAGSSGADPGPGPGGLA